MLVEHDLLDGGSKLCQFQRAAHVMVSGVSSSNVLVVGLATEGRRPTK